MRLIALLLLLQGPDDLAGPVYANRALGSNIVIEYMVHRGPFYMPLVPGRLTDLATIKDLLDFGFEVQIKGHVVYRDYTPCFLIEEIIK
jgi:hypothetical protein